MTRIGPGWVVGVGLVFVDLLMLMIVRSATVRLQLFQDLAETPLLWWPDWRIAGLATVVGFVPAAVAGWAAARRDSAGPSMIWGLAGLALIWLAFSPFVFGAGAALTPSGDIIIRENAPFWEQARWPASSVNVAIGCVDNGYRRRRPLKARAAAHQPVYEITLPTGRTLDLEGFRRGHDAAAIDDWIAVLATADRVLKAGGANRTYRPDEGRCVAGLITQSRRQDDVLGLYSHNAL